MEHFPRLIIWNLLLFEDIFILLGYYEKYGFSKGQKHLFMLLGFEGNGLVTLTVAKYR